MSNQFIEPELDNWISDTRRRRSFINRPIPLFFMLVISIGLTWIIFPKANLYFLEVKDCGDITSRPGQKIEERTPLLHDTFCTMTGVVSDLRVFSSGTEHLADANPKDGPLPKQNEFEDVRYFSKLAATKSSSYWMRLQMMSTPIDCATVETACSVFRLTMSVESSIPTLKAESIDELVSSYALTLRLVQRTK